MFSLNTLDAEVARLEEKIKAGSVPNGQDFANEVLAVAKAARSAIESIAKRVEILEDRLGASSGPGSLRKSVM